MKLNKEVRQTSRQLLQLSFIDGKLNDDRVRLMVEKLISGKPRNYLQILDAYKRLLRLEVEKRSATVETASEISPEASRELVQNLQSRYGADLATQFVVNPELLGGMRIRVGSDVWDSSVRNRLQRLQQQL